MIPTDEPPEWTQADADAAYAQVRACVYLAILMGIIGYLLGPRW